MDNQREKETERIIEEEKTILVNEGDSKKKSSVWYFLGGVFIGVVLVMALGLVLLNIHSSAQTSVSQSSVSSTIDEEMLSAALEKLAEINEYINETYIFEIDTQELIDSMLAGYLEGLGDVYSVYYTQEELASLLESVSGSYYGIGVLVSQTESGGLLVLTVFSDSPAQKAGMCAGDLIIGVDGMDTTDMDMNTVVAYIKGEEGSTVEITVARDGQELTLSVERGEVWMDTVYYEMLEDSIGYIQLIEFDEVSLEQMKTALTALSEQGMEGLILDLRDNPGGLLTSVLDIADLFLDGGNIFYMEEKSGSQIRYDASSGVSYEGNLIVLVNENSASAAEVLAGTLKDHELATLVGTTTFGKGIVQTYYSLSDGSGIKLTTAHYFTPNGTDIHGVGITPHIEVTNENSSEDIQLKTAIELLQEALEP